MNHAEQLEALITAVTASPKYRFMAPELIRRIGAGELAKRRSFKEAVKGTKNKLHQVGGAYLETKIDYAQALAALQAAQGDTAVFRQTCHDLMRGHVSTRERLPILEDFYTTILAGLPPIRHVVDVACGLNPLSHPWMPLADGALYEAYDIYGDMMAFLQTFFTLAGVNGRAHHQDVLSRPPTEPADLVLLLKTLPCLEQTEKGAAARLLRTLHTRYLLISYPRQSLGGWGKGMDAHYEAHFWQLADGRGWQVQRFEFATELAFLVTTDAR